MLLDGVNDTPEDARRLVTLLDGIKAKVNLLPLNEAPGIPFTRPSDERVNAFAKILADRDVIVSVRQEPRPRHPRRVRSAHRRGREGVSGTAIGERASVRPLVLPSARGRAHDEPP